MGGFKIVFTRNGKVSADLDIDKYSNNTQKITERRSIMRTIVENNLIYKYIKLKDLRNIIRLKVQNVY